MEAATESEAALGMMGWSGGRRVGLWRGSQPAEPLPPRGAGPRAWGRAALLCAQLCPRCRWECRVPAASHRAEEEGGSGWIPQEISVGCKDRERTRRRRRSTQSTLAACPGLFWRRGAGFVCCQGTLPAAERGPLCHLPLPTGGSCLGALDHKGLKELG